MVKQDYKFINFIKFKNLKEWDYKRYSVYSSTSEYPMEKLSKHIVNQTKKHNLFDYPSETFGILGISNDIGMFDAYEEKGENINQAYKIVENGFISYNPYRINVGSIGIKTCNVKNNYISPAYVVISCKETILPEFLFIIMKSNYFNRLIKARTTGSVRQTLSYKNLSEIEIPIPDIARQKEILNNYNNIIDRSKLLEEEARELEEKLDNILFEELGIKEIQEKEKPEEKLQFTSFKRLIKWGVELNLAPAGPDEIFLSDLFENVRLNSVAEINPRTDFEGINDDSPVSFLPMECISDVYGEITCSNKGSASGFKGYTKFRENDVLWAKITPSMQNGKCAIAEDLINGYGYGSTEYHVIRTDNKQLLNKFIYCFLRTNIIRKMAQYYFTGSAGQQRVSADFLENLVIPLPSINKQKEICNKIFSKKKEKKRIKLKVEKLQEEAKRNLEFEVFGDECL